MRGPGDPVRVGLIADTHGLLRPEAVDALRGSDLILHAGDVGGPDILERLGELAPTLCVRGNTDRGDWARDLPETRTHEVGGARLYMLHDLKALDFSPAEAGFAAVVSGHSHVPNISLQAGVLYVNPGSAGRRRFRLPVSVAVLEIVRGKVRAELISLEA